MINDFLKSINLIQRYGEMAKKGEKGGGKKEEERQSSTLTAFHLV